VYIWRLHLIEATSVSVIGRLIYKPNQPCCKRTTKYLPHNAPRYFHAKQQEHKGLFIASAEMENHMDEELILLKSLADQIPLFGRKPIKMPEKNNSKLTCKQRTIGYRLCIFYSITR
jgi:hypothetical protein